jgi:outer membrane protein
MLNEFRVNLSGKLLITCLNVLGVFLFLFRRIVKMRILLNAIGFGALLLVPSMRSQISSTATQSPSKVGTISLQAAITSTAEGRQASTDLQSQFAPRSTELQNMQKQIQDLQTRLQSGSGLNDQERGSLQRQGERLSRTFERKQQYFQEDLNAAQQDVINNIGRKLVAVVSQYSKENGYSVILDSSSQQTPVVYGAPQVDVTQDIVRLYDQSHPSKTPDAAPTKPATPKAPATAPKP